MTVDPNKKLERIILAAIQESPIPNSEAGKKRLAEHINNKIAEEAGKEESIYTLLYLDLYLARA